jgi:hypothetical protein
MKLGALTKGVGGSAIQGAVGAGTFYAHRMLASKVAFIQKNPLLAPVAILVLGHVLKKSAKTAPVGSALCGAAGYAGAQTFELKKAAAAANSTPTATTQGFEDDDTGALTRATDIGALTGASDIGGYYNAPDNASSYGETSGFEDAQSLGL